MKKEDNTDTTTMAGDAAVRALRKEAVLLLPPEAVLLKAHLVGDALRATAPAGPVPPAAAIPANNAIPADSSPAAAAGLVTAAGAVRAAAAVQVAVGAIPATAVAHAAVNWSTMLSITTNK